MAANPGARRQSLFVIVISGFLIFSPLVGPVTALSIPHHPDTHSLSTSKSVSSVANEPQTIKKQHPYTNLTSGESYWRGQQVHFNGAQIVSDPKSASVQDRTFQLRRVKNNRVGSLIREFTIDKNGRQNLGTVGIKGQFVIQYQGNTVSIQDGVGYLQSSSPEQKVTVTNSQWTVVEQTLTTTWSDDVVFNGQVTTVQLTSNRDDFVVAVSVTNRSFDDLTHLFFADDYADNHDALRDDNIILLNPRDPSQLPVNITGFTPGSTQFRISVKDTIAASRTPVTVKAPSGPQFGPIPETNQVGDIMSIPIECSHCYLVVGGQQEGFLEIIELIDEDNDGSIPLKLNTRYVGLLRNANGVPTHVSPYSAENATINRYTGGTRLPNGNTVNDLLFNTNLPIDGLDKPIGSGRYDLTLLASPAIQEKQGNLVLSEKRDVKTIELTGRSIGGITSFVSPAGQASTGDYEEYEASMTQQYEVAVGDRLVFQINVSGLEGHLTAEHNNLLHGIVDNKPEGIDFSFGPFVLDTPHVRVLNHSKLDRYLVVIDTRYARNTEPIQPNQAYKAEFRLSGVDRLDGYSVHKDSQSHDGYPYISPGTQETITTDVTFVNPVVHVTGQADAMDLGNNRQTIIQGNTSLAPGSTLTITVMSDGSDPWTKSNTTIVQPDGSWRGTLDFSNTIPGQQFTGTISHKRSTMTTFDGVVVEKPPPSTSTQPERNTSMTPTGNESGNTSVATDQSQQPTTTVPPEEQSKTNESSTQVSNSSSEFVLDLPLLPTLKIPIPDLKLPTIPVINDILSIERNLIAIPTILG